VTETTEARDEIFDKPLTYENDEGKIIYRASGLGGCVRSLVLSRLGVTPSPPSDFMAERFQEGHDWEREVLARGLEQAGGQGWVEVTNPDHLALYGRVVQEEGDVMQVETELAWSNKVIRCHPDAIAVNRDGLDQRVVEAKFLSSEFASAKYREIDKATKAGKHPALGLGEQYAWQVAVEMLSTGLPMLYVIGEKEVGENEDGGRVVTGIGTVQVWEWDEPPFSLAEVKARVLEVEGYVARGEMPPCPVPLQYPCGFWREHEEREEIEEITDPELDKLVEEFARANGEAHKLADRAAKLKVQMLERMRGIGMNSGKGHGLIVSRVSARPGNVSWAKWAQEVKKKHPEVTDVDEEKFRGKEVAETIRVEEIDKKKGSGK